MRPSLKWSLCLGLLVWLGGALPARAADGRTAAARQLARTERAAAATAQAARAREAGLPPGGAFRTALQKLSGALARAEAGLRAGDARYFAALSDGSRALAELEAVWARMPRRDAAVGSRMTTLSAAYRRLRNGYGWEALRRGQGSALTAAEASRFHALKQADAQLAAHLKPVQAKAAKTGDRAMAEQLARLSDQARRVAAAELTLEAYLTAELLNDIVRGEWEAAQHYVKKPYRATWKKSAPAIEKLATDPGIGFVFAADLSKAEAWTFDDAGNGGEEAAPADREAAAPAAPRDQTPVDDVEIVDGRSQRTEGVAPEGETSAEPGAAPEPAQGDAAPPAAAEAPAPPSPPAAEPPAPAPGESTPPASAPPAAEPTPPVAADAAPPAAAEPVPAEPSPDGEAPPADAPAAEPAPAPSADAPDAPPDDGDFTGPPATSAADAAPPGEEPPPDASADAPPPDAPSGDQPAVQPPADAPPPPGDPATLAPPPADPNAPDATQPDQPPPSPPSDDEPLPSEPPPPPPPPPRV